MQQRLATTAARASHAQAAISRAELQQIHRRATRSEVSCRPPRRRINSQNKNIEWAILTMFLQPGKRGQNLWKQFNLKQIRNILGANETVGVCQALNLSASLPYFDPMIDPHLCAVVRRVGAGAV